MRKYGIMFTRSTTQALKPVMVDGLYESLDQAVEALNKRRDQHKSIPRECYSLVEIRSMVSKLVETWVPSDD